MPKAFYRRKLPHLQRDFKPHFLTFCTYHRWLLPEAARAIVLDCCQREDLVKISLHAAVVMPDHVHLIFTPLVNECDLEIYSLAQITNAIKGASSHKINRLLGRRGSVWQTESFDHVLRSSESLDEKIDYVLQNPVRRGVVTTVQEYRWLYYKPNQSPYAPPQTA
jgi:REP element-mobilizing transposase RayT